MAFVGKGELIEKSLTALEDAKQSLSLGDAKDAEIEIEIAKVYARLSDSIGDKRVFVGEQVGNW